MIALHLDVAVDTKSDRVELFDSFLNGTRIVSKETVRINELNRSVEKESFLSLTVPQKYRNIKSKEKKRKEKYRYVTSPHEPVRGNRDYNFGKSSSTLYGFFHNFSTSKFP